VKPITLAAFLPLWPVLVVAQVAEQNVSPEPRVATVLAGVGNPMGVLGFQVDYYFHHERFSLFAGTGYAPCDTDEASGIAFAAGARAFTGGRTHRALLEVSVSMLGYETLSQGGVVLLARKRYGPGIQAGYQYTGRGGLTFMGTVGLGYALGLDSRNPNSPMTGMLALGLGYTWRSRPDPPLESRPASN
jgi:hypothetical protein